MLRILRRKHKFKTPSNKEGSIIFMVGKSEIQIGEFTYGWQHLGIREWGEGSNLKIGKFCSIADNVSVFLGGNHRVDWVSTFPFGHVSRETLGSEQIPGHPMSKGGCRLDVTSGLAVV